MHTKLLIVLGLFLLLIVSWNLRLRQGHFGIKGSLGGAAYHGPCRASTEPRSLITQISDTNEANEAVSKLLVAANASRECRDEVVHELIQAMSKEQEFSESNFRLWRKGSGILGKLKAVEALDLLIDNLDLNDGLFSASMVHQPVVSAVEAMGDLAVPKLAIALKHHPRRSVRLAAALCLFDIGGSDASEAMNSALSSETDQCVRRFIMLSLPDQAKASEPKRQVSAQDGELLRQRLMAFNCSN